MAGPQKILLVEDNPQIVDIYTSVLVKHGYLLSVATTVDEALVKAKEIQPDIIFLDVMLPGDKSGLDALMILRTKPEYGCMDKRIVILTNLGLTEKLQKIWEEYADGYVIKAEIVPNELIDVIQSFEKDSTQA
jgi:two-component system alkaline phosphatase synthesis response regulator PhoP